MILVTKNYHLAPFYMQTPNQMNISECMLAVITNDYVLACSMLAGFIAITYLALSYARVSYMPKTPQWLMSIIVAVAIAGVSVPLYVELHVKEQNTINTQQAPINKN
ncbi:hypothetical protein BCT30_14300 [Enterovibrio norvegicus]|nr:hypothetical protein A1OS_06715 [Enterovibrio norvegicus]OEF48505.1 hypothetical protein A1OW_15330 [Enterovibrio norvegicus]PMI31736.1 hypothetical protein BCU47_14250 [Enterovibrio norvegicus]PMI38628.1 hypothetical protein BCU46_01205 [Enterovibrio norvegicus]PMN51895.1 hypothetical protein BCT30_14300 [Enterovibrio norvegicus]